MGAMNYMRSRLIILDWIPSFRACSAVQFLRRLFAPTWSQGDSPNGSHDHGVAAHDM